jgi:hypothetical protein
MKKSFLLGWAGCSSIIMAVSSYKLENND